MNNFSSERSKSWNTYTSANPTPSQTAADDSEAPWKDFGTSVNAISFGFVATAILISLFLIMAIFEHLLSPRSSLPSTQDAAEGALESGHMRSRRHILEKLGSPQIDNSILLSSHNLLLSLAPEKGYVGPPIMTGFLFLTNQIYSMGLVTLIGHWIVCNQYGNQVSHVLLTPALCIFHAAFASRALAMALTAPVRLCYFVIPRASPLGPTVERFKKSQRPQCRDRKK